MNTTKNTTKTKDNKINLIKKLLMCEQMELKENVKNILKSRGYKPVDGDGFLYAEGKIPILLVAHLDTVHKTKPTEIFYDSEQDVMWSPQGIGGDDRCGVYAILKLLCNHHPYVLFTEDEEKGCIGADKTVEVLKKPNVKFIIEIDRRGSDDCVFYDCGNQKFQEYIEKFGFEFAWGSYSDICVLSGEWDIASVNLSSGYYNEHTDQEYIKLRELEKTIDRVRNILDDNENAEFYDYQEKLYLSNTKALSYNSPYNSTYFDEWGYTDDEGKWHWYADERYYD